MARPMDAQDGQAPVPASTRIGASRFANLGVRLASALAMAVVALGALFLGFPFWPMLVLIIVMGTAWEWNRMLSRSGSVEALALIAGLAVVTALAAFDLAAIAVIVSIVGFVVLVAVGKGRGRKTHAVGMLYFGLPSVALIWLAADPRDGALALLLVMVVVWVTDSAAFFTGRMVGGPKLWPSVSPNKTWAGSIGGLAGGVVAGVIYAALAGVDALVSVGLLSLGLSVACQAGDLLESGIKRRFDIKDTSGLIPGHGGLMDRLDGLIGAVLLAAIVALIVSPGAPAEAILPGLSR